MTMLTSSLPWPMRWSPTRRMALEVHFCGVAGARLVSRSWERGVHGEEGEAAAVVHREFPHVQAGALGLPAPRLTPSTAAVP